MTITFDQPLNTGTETGAILLQGAVNGTNYVYTLDIIPTLMTVLRGISVDQNYIDRFGQQRNLNVDVDVLLTFSDSNKSLTIIPTHQQPTQ